MSSEAIVEVFRQIQSTAFDVDASFSPPEPQLRLLAEAGYFSLTARAEASIRRRLLDQLSAACGATAFLASQHEASCRRLLSAGHPLFASAERGRDWVGICFAHLRRDPSPVTVRDGTVLQFDGEGPWFSGVGLMQKLLLAGATPDGRFLMALVELDAPGLTVGRPFPLAVMNATATASLELRAVKANRSELVLENDTVSMNQADMHATVMQSSRSLGVARACAEFLPATAQQALLGRIERIHFAMDRWDTQPTWPTATELRVQALVLSASVVAAAFAAVGGRANALGHPLQRMAREATFYATAQTTEELRLALSAAVSVGDRPNGVDLIRECHNTNLSAY